MRWKQARRSQNVEDRRGKSTGAKIGGGLGIGTIILFLIVLFLGGDPSALLSGGGSGGGATSGVAAGSSNYTPSPEEQERAEMASAVLAYTEDVWGELFAQHGKRYRPPKMVLYSGQTTSACGVGKAQMGPFYCPGDEKVYLDLSFFTDLKKRHGAPGDFAQAYVIAHEVGHHIQKLLGYSDKVQAMRRKVSEKEGNQLSVRLELQADYLAGVWAHHGHKRFNFLDRGDPEEALNAASAIGDDRLQKQGRGYVTPDSFTHGSSEQRVRWFRKGLETGDLSMIEHFFTAQQL